MKAGGLVPENLIQPTISLEMPVPSQGDNILVSEYKLFKRSNKANLLIALVQ
jgi:hypothetical protein